MTRLEAVSRAIYLTRMRQCGIVNYILPFELLSLRARQLCDATAYAALAAADSWPVPVKARIAGSGQ